MYTGGVREVNSTNLTRTAEVSPQSSHTVVQVFLGVISVSALLGNGLVCVALMRNREILRSAYNTFLFSLAITDMLTGVCILATPTLVIPGDSFPVLTGVSGELFCRLVSSQYFVFAFSKVSVFTVTVMSMERWYSIVRPFQYRTKFKKKRIHIHLVLIWILGIGSVGFVPFGRVFISPTNNCIWSWAPFHRELLITLFPLLTFFIPSLIACLTLLHIYLVLKRSPLQEAGNRNAQTKRKLLRMCSIVVFLFFLCWLPNQLYYALSAYNITTLETPFHYFTIVLAMSNSSLNPWVYCFANRQIKRGILSLLDPVLNLLQKRSTTYGNWKTSERGKIQFEMQNVSNGILLSFRNLTVVE
ncbi:QRFP-like peptide receptor [Oculina patagonica]